MGSGKFALDNGLTQGCDSIVVYGLNQWGHHRQCRLSLSVFFFVGLGTALRNKIRVSVVLLISIGVRETVHTAESVGVGAA